MDIYKGRETRHRAKSLAHATEFEFRLKVGSSMSSSQALHHPVTLCKAVQGLRLLCAAADIECLVRNPSDDRFGKPREAVQWGAWLLPPAHAG